MITEIVRQPTESYRCVEVYGESRVLRRISRKESIECLLKGRVFYPFVEFHESHEFG